MTRCYRPAEGFEEGISLLGIVGRFIHLLDVSYRPVKRIERSSVPLTGSLLRRRPALSCVRLGVNSKLGPDRARFFDGVAGRCGSSTASDAFALFLLPRGRPEVCGAALCLPH